VTDRPTDNATRSVTIGYVYLRSSAMRPNNNNNNTMRNAYSKWLHKRWHYQVCGTRIKDQ